MSIAKILFKLSDSFPAIRISTNSSKILKKVAPEVNENRYVVMSIFLAAILALICALSTYLISSNIYSAFIISILFFSLFGVLFLKIPEVELNNYIEEFEVELPLALRTIGILINFGLPFQKAFAFIIYEDTALAKEVRSVISDSEKGVEFSKSLSHLAKNTGSQPIKRAIAQIITAYSHGQHGNEIKAIADELLALQQYRFRDAAVRSSTFGLLFVAVTALLPTFFTIISVLGPALFSIAISEQTLIFVLMIIFPSISLLVLLVAKASLPRALFKKEKPPNLQVILLTCILILLMLVLPQPYNYAALTIGSIVIGILLYDKYKKEKRKELVEARLPDALFTIATLPKASTTEQLFYTIERGGHGPLSDEASISIDQLRAGVKTELVLQDVGKRNDSGIVKRVFEIIEYAINTNSFDKLSTVAEDLLKFSEINRERVSILSMQKYTLIFGGFLVPTILKITISLLNKVGAFLDPSAIILLPVASKIAPAYIIVYSLLVSYYISEIEQKESTFAVCSILLTVAGLIIFSIVSI